ncbi:hypothetical protein [Sphingomonas solaris]|uniref:Uncharacterized protein n=1 Tax=Alterirhizorhabdus solaris TaxID=2529389 RepID=A0A558R7K9_9SPHN|nr:hypothetical protein [Sphingomonas solaris]TVV75356.1 hypothetical protein FOY91_07165 [Sphingomonas solaris]
MMQDAQTLLLRAMRTTGDPMPGLRAAHSEAWASATFAGARHRFELEPASPGHADAFAVRLTRADYRLPGHLVADIVVAARTETTQGIALTIEALTVEDG